MEKPKIITTYNAHWKGGGIKSLVPSEINRAGNLAQKMPKLEGGYP